MIQLYQLVEGDITACKIVLHSESREMCRLSTYNGLAFCGSAKVHENMTKLRKMQVISSPVVHIAAAKTNQSDDVINHPF